MLKSVRYYDTLNIKVLSCSFKFFENLNLQIAKLGKYSNIRKTRFLCIFEWIVTLKKIKYLFVLSYHNILE